MKQILILVVMVLFVLIFPLSMLQLPDELILKTKSQIKDIIANGQSEQHTSEINKQNVGKIKMGMTKQQVNHILGQPNQQLLNEYQQHWTVYHRNYKSFILVMFKQNVVHGVYSNQNMITIAGIKFGMPRAIVEEKLGQPLKIFDSEQYRLNLDNKEMVIYDKNNNYIVLFYDKYENNRVMGIKVIDKSINLEKSYHYANPNITMQKDYAKLHFEILNAARKMHQLSPLNYDERVTKVAQKHADDMAINNFFSHNNKQQETPFDRLKKDGIMYSLSGENIAYGQVSPIEAHHGLMNSLGHRKNILKSDYENIGIGIAFNNKNQPFYVENYISK